MIKTTEFMARKINPDIDLDLKTCFKIKKQLHVGMVAKKSDEARLQIQVIDK